MSSSLLKQRISSPLEAGTSILDSQNLPPHLTQALEYASKRLSRKALHITLMVVRKEYQLPSSTLPCATTSAFVSSSSVSTPASPDPIPGPLSSPSRFASPVAGLRQLVRRGTGSSVASSVASIDTTATSSASLFSAPSESSPSLTSRSTAASPTFPPPPTESRSPRRYWPPTPGSPPPCTPMTPHTPSSVITSATASTSTSTSSTASAGGPNPFGIRLIYTSPLHPKAEKTLRTTIAKAERKFRAGTGWLLPPTSTAAACGLNADLIRRSLLQNEVLFSAEGLTLLGLDRLYTFKSALAAYARTTLPSFCGSAVGAAGPDGGGASRIEDAVDELRRLVLANGGRRVAKADLHRCYEWIGVSAGALSDVESMYRRAYGGLDRIGAFEVDEERERERERERCDTRTVSPGIVKIGTPPAPKGPVLKLQTTFEKPLGIRKPAAVRPVPLKPAAVAAASGMEASREATGEALELEVTIERCDEEDEEDGDLTARPAIPGMSFWNALGASIDEMLQEDATSPAVGPHHRVSRMSQASRMGPMTPNGYDDISPVTRGEWGFLFSGDGWKGGKTAAVETC